MPPLAVDETEPSPEMQAIQLKWTPELKAMLARGSHIHPYIGPEYLRGKKHPYQAYKPGIPLPNPADPFMFLQWCGLRDTTIREVSDKFYKENEDLVARTPKRGYISRLNPSGVHIIDFPILNGMVTTYAHMLGYGEIDYDYEESFGE